MVSQSVEKENPEFKKIDFCHILSEVEGLGKYIHMGTIQNKKYCTIFLQQKLILSINSNDCCLLYSLYILSWNECNLWF